MNPATYTIETTRRLLADEGFKSRHRASDQAFTRVRCLPFAVVLVLILRKSVKSLQNIVNEAMVWLRVAPVTASAFSQARYPLQHPAFRALIETVNDQLKNISQVEHTRHRSITGFMLNMLGALVAYTYQEKKPSLHLETAEPQTLPAII